MRILISIATFGVKNQQYLNKVIDEYKSFKKYETDIIVHGTDPLNRDDIRFISHENPRNTVFFHRSDFVKNQNNYDYFIFTEDDILIKEETIDLCVNRENKIPINHVIGFLRFENTPENNRYLIDLWTDIPGYSYIRERNININQDIYFSVTNPHQSCYVLSQQKLKYAIENSNYEVNGTEFSADILETASSGIFTDWYMGIGVLKKIIPMSKNDIENCLIEHLPGNHCNAPGINANTPPEVFRNCISNIDQLLSNLDLK